MNGLQLTWSESGVDLGVAGGSLATGDTRAQEEWLLLATRRGEWKEHPLVGVGAEDMAGDEDTAYWEREIADQLARIGIRARGVSLKNGTLEIKH